MGTNEMTRDALADSAIHEKWVAHYRSPEAEGFYEMAFDEIVKRLGAPPDATILDAGCGSCAKSVLLASRGLRVVGADFSQAALDLAEKTIRAKHLEGRITLRQADLLNLPFKDGEFQYVICWGVLIHIPDVERALSELARVTAPGGTLVLSEANMHSAQQYLTRSLKAVFGSGRSKLERTAAGLETREHTEQGLLVTRVSDIAWMARHCEGLGLHLKTRIPGQLSELYALMPWRWLRRAIHVANSVWFRMVRMPGPAFGNILMFEKRT